MAEGTILFVKITDNGRFGFLTDHALAGNGSRENDVYFDTRSLVDRSVELVSGMRVRFLYAENSRHDERLRAKFKSMEIIK
jgi:hypothetical protein